MDALPLIILKQGSHEKNVSFAQAAKKFQACIKKAPVDLSTNPDYLVISL